MCVTPNIHTIIATCARTFPYYSKEEKGFDAVREEAAEEEDDFNFIRSKSSAVSDDAPRKKAEPSKLVGLGAAASFAK